MSNEQKTAIQQAEKQLEQERKAKLQREVYDYLRQELDRIDDISQKIKKLETDKRAHEENIKNVKQGNLEAIGKRRQAMGWAITSANPFLDANTINPWNGHSFYNSNVAGFTYTTSSGKTYIF